MFIYLKVKKLCIMYLFFIILLNKKYILHL